MNVGPRHSQSERVHCHSHGQPARPVLRPPATLPLAQGASEKELSGALTTGGRGGEA